MIPLLISNTTHWLWVGACFGRAGQAGSGASLISKAARRVKVNKLEVKDDERYEE
jgi:hypothetical protein